MCLGEWALIDKLTVCTQSGFRRIGLFESSIRLKDQISFVSLVVVEAGAGLSSAISDGKMMIMRTSLHKC